MTNNKRRKAMANRTLIRYRPAFDGLEVRFVLSNLGISDPNGVFEDNATVLVGAGLGEDSAESVTNFNLDQSAFVGPLSVVQTNPASDSATTRNISSVSVTFDREIDPFTILSGDFFLERSADSSGPARSISVETAFLDESNPTNRRISFTLNTSLPIGQYQIMLSGLSELAGVDGTRATAGDDQVLGTFRIESDQLNLGGALDLGTVSGTEIVHPGRLDLTSDPSASDLYKITVPAGQDWNFSLDVSAQRDGFSLDAVATLFDAQGRMIATADRGKPDAPLDPSLTRRLPGGVYYIAVAGKLTGGSTDGSYRIHLAASPSVAMTSVTNIQELRANPNTLELTGLAIDFSGPIDPESLLIKSSRVVSLVDSQGQAWPISLTGLSAGQTRLTFVLGAALPVGSYQIRMGVDSTLADLSGRAPVGQGLATGVLGSINVVAQAKPAATELGTLWASVDSKVGGVVTLANGITQTRSFTLLAQGSVALIVVGDAGSARFSIIDAAGRPIASVLESTPDGSVGTQWNYVLGAGTYTLSIESDEAVATSLGFALIVKSTPASSLLDSGVGQGTTDPKVIAPAPPKGTVVIAHPSELDNTGPGLQVDPINRVEHAIVETHWGEATHQGPLTGYQGSAILISSPAAGMNPLANGQGAGAFIAPGETSAATILIGGIPVGHPTATFDVINVVGPAPSAGSFALASNHPTLPNGLLQVVAESLVGDSREVGDPAATIWGRPYSANQKAPSITPRAEGLVEASDPMRDHATLDLSIDLGWFPRVAAWVEDFLDTDSSAVLDQDVPDGSIAIRTVDQWAEPASRIDSASLTTPALLIGSVLAVYRMRTELRRRVRRLVGRVDRASTISRHDFQPNCRTGLS